MQTRTINRSRNPKQTWGKEKAKNQFTRTELKKPAVSKEKEAQPSKMDTIKRLEKEKKAMQRKKQEKEQDKRGNGRPQIKERRMKHTDWKRIYESGDYEEL